MLQLLQTNKLGLKCHQISLATITSAKAVAMLCIQWVTFPWISMRYVRRKISFRKRVYNKIINKCQFIFKKSNKFKRSRVNRCSEWRTNYLGDESRLVNKNYMYSRFIKKHPYSKSMTYFSVDFMELFYSQKWMNSEEE